MLTAAQTRHLLLLPVNSTSRSVARSSDPEAFFGRLMASGSVTVVLLVASVLLVAMTSSAYSMTVRERYELEHKAHRAAPKAAATKRSAHHSKPAVKAIRATKARKLHPARQHKAPGSAPSVKHHAAKSRTPTPHSKRTVVGKKPSRHTVSAHHSVVAKKRAHHSAAIRKAPKSHKASALKPSAHKKMAHKKATRPTAASKKPVVKKPVVKKSVHTKRAHSQRKPVSRTRHHRHR